MIYRPVFRLVLSALERPEDKARAYAVVIDPSSGQSGVYLDGVPWPSEFFAGEMGEAPAPPTYVAGPLGIVSLQTQETMHGHGASLSLLVGEVGASLRKRILPHDLLRVELFEAATKRWRCAFDGHLSGIHWSKQSDPGSYRWRMDISAAGLQKIFSEQWLDWQSMVRAADSKNVFGKGFSFFQELAQIKGDLPVSELLRKFITGAVDQFLEFGVRGQRAGVGQTFQVSPVARDWQTAWDLFVFATGNWYLMQRGALWSLLAGLSEPDVHEFFITYAEEAGATEFREIPSLVFRPRPWPGPPAYAVTARADGIPGDDDSLWRELDLVVTGVPGAPAALRVGTSRSDTARANCFFISLSGTNDTNPNDLSFTRTALGFRVDEALVKRYGFSSRQVSLGSLLKRAESYFEFILPSLLDRVAWQEAPLPFLLDQTRTFPLMPGVHVGSVLQDHSESQDAPTTGYIISVSHSITGSAKSLRAETVIGTTRALEGVTVDDYPAAVRRLVNLQKVSFLSGAEVDIAMRNFAGAEHSQPGAVAPVGGDDNLLVTDRPDLQGVPTRAVMANLAWLKQRGIDPVRALVGSMILTSVYRSAALNRVKSGRPDSDHMKGLAFDFQMPGGVAATAAAYATLVAHKASLGFKECVLETKDGKTWVHYAIFPAGGSGAGSAASGSTGE